MILSYVSRLVCQVTLKYSIGSWAELIPGKPAWLNDVLSVPPGVGQGRSMILTAGLRMLRYRGSWRLAVLLRAGGAVLVGRPG